MQLHFLLSLLAKVHSKIYYTCTSKFPTTESILLMGTIACYKEYSQAKTLLMGDGGIKLQRWGGGVIVFINKVEEANEQI